MRLGKELHDFVLLCVEHGVRFLVVGGHAVAAHGHPRLTKDLDIWVWVNLRTPSDWPQCWTSPDSNHSDCRRRISPSRAKWSNWDIRPTGSAY